MTSLTLDQFADRNRKRIVTTREPKGKGDTRENYWCKLEDSFVKSGSNYVQLTGYGSSASEAKNDLAEKIKGQTVFFTVKGDRLNFAGGIQAPEHFEKAVA